MSIDGIAAIVFILLLGTFLLLKRSKLSVQGVFPFIFIVMYRSLFGLQAMKFIAGRFTKVLKLLGILGVVVGFIGMILICLQLVIATFQLFAGTAPPSIQPVLPFEAKGVFYVPFLYWIISIFLLAFVHEFAHGILSNIYSVPVKSSGFAFLCVLLPIIPAAFVEPEESVLKKKPFRQQLAVFAAGPFSNILFALIMIGVVVASAPVLSSAFDESGVELTGISDNLSAFNAGLKQGEIITSIDNFSVSTFGDFQSVLKSLPANSEVTINTSERSVPVLLGAHPQNASIAYLGVQAKQHLTPNAVFVAKYSAAAPYIIKWFSGLFFWLFLLNLGIGLFNLLPIGPVDGGRMFQLVCLRFFKKEKTALRVWSHTSTFFILLILFNLFAGFIL